MPSRMTSTALDTMIATILFTNGMMRSYQDFLAPFLIAANSFAKKRKKPFSSALRPENLRDYLALLRFNLQIADGAARSSLMQMNQYYKKESKRFILH